MPKEAITDLKLNSLLKKRWSPRAFDSRPVEKEKLLNILEAARWSPSSSNQQPWVFIVGQKGDETYDRIFSTLVEFNKLWAGNAPVLVMNCGKTTNAAGDAPNKSWQYDLGQAVAHMSVQAMHEGIYAHQMGGFDADKAGNLFGLPGDHRAFTVTAFGYIGDPDMLPVRMQKSEKAVRERKELDTFVFAADFGNISDIIK